MKKKNQKKIYKNTLVHHSFLYIQLSYHKMSLEGMISLPVRYHVPSRGYDVTSCLVPCSFREEFCMQGEGSGPWEVWSWREWVPPLVLTSNGGHCSSQYASYWNAFLFTITAVIAEIAKNSNVLGKHGFW